MHRRRKPNRPVPRVAAAILIASLLLGCGTARDDTSQRRREIDARVRAKWGKPLADLPTQKLVVISPHNQNIRNEFEQAFVWRHALAHGRRVVIDWRDTGGGSSSIMRFIRNMYKNSESSGIDILWGGGDYHFSKLAKDGLLATMTLQPDFLATVPPDLGGVPTYAPDRTWCGAALSGFGFIYNSTMLDRCGLKPPTRWDDLARPELFGLVALADPTESGSAAAAFEMVVQSADDWPAGWAKLLDVMSNAKRFTDSAGKAANAPALGEALVATCIDFYGFTRVAEAPEDLAYLSPPGQTAYTPDPIAILKNPPHPELAQQFVDFVLSREGQAIWALPPGHPHGPARVSLGRVPMRKDVFEAYTGQLSPWIQNPYEAGRAAQMDLEMRGIRFNVLKKLVQAAAIENLPGLQAAKRKLIDTGFPATLLADFHSLPANVRTRAQIKQVAAALRDPTEADKIQTEWRDYFRRTYRRIAGAAP